MSDRPKRIQRKRVKGWRMPEGAVYVGRPGYFGNPFTGEFAANDYRRWLTDRMSPSEFERTKTNRWALYHDKENVWREMPRLRGKDLVCWCPRHCECHADVLIELANAPLPRPKETDQP